MIKNNDSIYSGCGRMLQTEKPIQRSALFLASCLVLIELAGCSQSTSTEALEKYDAEMQRQRNVSNEEGRTLTDIAGKATAPALEKTLSKASIDPQAVPYVGRYYASISCEDPLVSCESGHADFILNLLPDGTAHRTIIHLGTITFESHKQYRQDTWSYQPELKQITLHRASGVEFFYTMQDTNTMVLNREKVRNFTQTNIDFFAQGGAFPLENYVLKRAD